MLVYGYRLMAQALVEMQAKVNGLQAAIPKLIATIECLHDDMHASDKQTFDAYLGHLKGHTHAVEETMQAQDRRISEVTGLVLDATKSSVDKVEEDLKRATDRISTTFADIALRHQRLLERVGKTLDEDDRNPV